MNILFIILSVFWPISIKAAVSFKSLPASIEVAENVCEYSINNKETIIKYHNEGDAKVDEFTKKAWEIGTLKHSENQVLTPVIEYNEKIQNAGQEYQMEMIRLKDKHKREWDYHQEKVKNYEKIKAEIDPAGVIAHGLMRDMYLMSNKQIEELLQVKIKLDKKIMEIIKFAVANKFPEMTIDELLVVKKMHLNNSIFGSLQTHKVNHMAQQCHSHMISEINKNTPMTGSTTSLVSNYAIPTFMSDYQEIAPALGFLETPVLANSKNTGQKDRDEAKRMEAYMSRVLEMLKERRAKTEVLNKVQLTKKEGLKNKKTQKIKVEIGKIDLGNSRADSLDSSSATGSFRKLDYSEKALWRTIYHRDAVDCQRKEKDELFVIITKTYCRVAYPIIFELHD